MSRWVDRLAVVFPFEEQLFRDAGVPTTYVGHPLLEDLHPEVDAAGFRAELGVTADAMLLGLLPGSREQEVRAHAPVMLEAAARLASSRPSLVPVMAMAADVSPQRLAALVGGTLEPGAPANGPWRVRRGGTRAWFVRGRTHAVQAHASACAVASGTATLETALFATPLVIVYRMGWLNYTIARRLVSLSHVGLPNIVAGSEVAPELIQDAFTPERVAETLARWLDDPAARAEASRSLGAVRARLGMAGASERAAEALAELLA
jgi:lipid-A-disaccharide synthase